MRIVSSDEDFDEPPVGLAEAFSSLPMFTDPHLAMQAMNLDIVDHFLMESEADLLREYIRIEQTPLPAAMFVSALSQLWLFGVYELLRTWRQRGKDVLSWARELEGIPKNERSERIGKKRLEIEGRATDVKSAVFYWPAYEEATLNPFFKETVRLALDRTERLFRRIEAFRVALAKHELPGSKSSFAPGAGFGRIDMTDGSIYWQVVLRGVEVDIMSRRTIADECRRLLSDDYSMILPEAIQEKIKKFAYDSYGIKKVILILNDASVYPGVYVAWNREVVQVEGHESIPFQIIDVVDAKFDSNPGPPISS